MGTKIKNKETGSVTTFNFFSYNKNHALYKNIRDIYSLEEAVHIAYNCMATKGQNGFTGLISSQNKEIKKLQNIDGKLYELIPLKSD